MGARKRESANRRKEALKTQYFAKLNNVPTSPRKMRLAADMVRGMEVFKALGVLKFSNKEASQRLENCCVLPLPIGSKRTNAKPKTENFTSLRSMWIVQRCLNVFVRLREEEVTEFVNVRTM